VANSRHPSGITPLGIIAQAIRVAGTRARILLLQLDIESLRSLRSLPGNFMMFKPGFSVAVLVTTAVLSVGSCFSSIGQAAAATGTKIATVVANPSAGARASATQVYLMRGFLNVFSLGMDGLAAELRRSGIAATVGSYTEWQEAAREIAANYKAGRRGPIVLVGHSFGADAVMDMGQYLGEMGVPVALIVPFDGTYSHAASANVARVLNIYKSADAKITRGPGFHGELTNYYVADANVSHTNIDKVPRLHSMVINKIRGTRSSGSAASAPPGTSG
jgi:dienelactone hydrolase